MEVGKLNPLVEKFVEKFWEEFREVKECQKIEDQKYICEYNETVFIVSGGAPTHGYNGYDIWIKVPNTEWYGHVEVKYKKEEDVISVRHSIRMSGDDEYSTHMWEALLQLVNIAATKAVTARDKAYEELKRQTSGRDLLEIFIEEFWREFDEVAKKDGIKRVEGKGPKYVYVNGTRMYTIYGRKDGDIDYTIWIEAPNSHSSDISAYVEVFHHKDRGELSIEYSIGAEGEEYYTWYQDLVKLATKIIAVAETARKRAYKIAKRAQDVS